MIEIWRGEMIESYHNGHAIVIDGDGNILAEWGDPKTMIYPRSSIKMAQSLPSVESGAFKTFGLGLKEIALSCASHQGSSEHTKVLFNWLRHLGLDEHSLMCGIHPPLSVSERIVLGLKGEVPSQIHNNCSGKHCGFLTLSKKLKTDPEYINIDHPVQKAILSTIQELTEEKLEKFGIDGCSAPNYACSLKGLSLAMSKFAKPKKNGRIRNESMLQILEAMMKFPYLVAGKGRACSELIAELNEAAVVKTGAEGVYTAIVPKLGVGIALKICDGSSRASEAAITTLLIRLGLLEKNSPAAKKRVFSSIENWRGIKTGFIQPTASFWSKGRIIK